jgi:hypothetical protein
MTRGPSRTMLLFGAAAVAILALLVAVGALRGDDGPEPPDAVVRGLFPDFDPDALSYVSRCGRGAPAPLVAPAAGTTIAVGDSDPRSRRTRLRPRVGPGEDFAFTLRRGEERRRYDVRCLPADFPNFRFEGHRPMPPGAFTVSLTQPGRKFWVIVFDHQGAPRWWYRTDGRTLWSQVLESGRVLWARAFGDGYGLDPRMAHEIRSLSGRLVRLVRTRGWITDGHEYEELPGDNVMLVSYRPAGGNDLTPFGGDPDSFAVFPVIEEQTPAGRVVWRWTSRGRIKLGETGRWWPNILANAKPGPGGVPTYDPVHINSVDPRGRDELVVSMRHTDGIYGVDRHTGRILWKLGGTETPKSLRVLGDPAHRLFGGQHDARIQTDGTLSVFDNSKDRPRLPRVVSYRLDTEEGTATYLGQLTDPEVTYSHCCGSARLLPGGGWLVSWGDNPLVTAFDEKGRIAFRLHMAAPSFRAVPVPEGAATPADLERGMEAMEPGGRGRAATAG